MLTAALVVAGGGIYGIARWWRLGPDPTTSELLRQLPQRNAVLFHVDISAIRSAGLMSTITSAGVTEDPEYLAFVKESGFDWRSDLDSVTGSQAGDDWFIFVKGRFDWAKLQNYAIARGGSCRNGVCDAPAVTPGRRISFYAKTSRVLGMATSKAPNAVYGMHGVLPGAELERAETAPVWYSIPGPRLASAAALPNGSKLFAKALEQAKRATFGVHQTGNTLELVMRADCADSTSAASLQNQLSGVTAEFSKYFERLGQKPSSADLSGLILNGKFQLEGSSVQGRWPLSADFIRNLFGGGGA